MIQNVKCKQYYIIVEPRYNDYMLVVLIQHHVRWTSTLFLRFSFFYHCKIFEILKLLSFVHQRLCNYSIIDQVLVMYKSGDCDKERQAKVWAIIVFDGAVLLLQPSYDCKWALTRFPSEWPGGATVLHEQGLQVNSSSGGKMTFDLMTSHRSPRRSRKASRWAGLFLECHLEGKSLHVVVWKPVAWKTLKGQLNISMLRFFPVINQ